MAGQSIVTARRSLTATAGRMVVVWFFRDITERKRMQRQILEAAERERQRIGQDLHDDLCQQLAGIACLGQAAPAAPGQTAGKQRRCGGGHGDRGEDSSKSTSTRATWPKDCSR